jgi:hypothetical protein
MNAMGISLCKALSPNNTAEIPCSNRRGDKAVTNNNKQVLLR